MGFFDFLKPKTVVSNVQPRANTPTSSASTVTPPTSSESKTNKLTVKCAGVKYNQLEKIVPLGKQNPEFMMDKSYFLKKYNKEIAIYQYIFPTYVPQFEFDPTNKFDPNAIKILINGIHVGYVKKGSCSRIRNLINQDKIKSASAKITGGKYKSLYLAGEEDAWKLGSGFDDFHVTLTLELK